MSNDTVLIYGKTELPADDCNIWQNQKSVK